MTQLTHSSMKLSTTNSRAASRQVARVRLVAAAALAVASLFSANVLAAGGVKVAKVTRGSATVETSGSNTVIRASDRAIINFRQFDVVKGSRVQFIQPGEMSRVLSRITGGTPSRIDGSITANGQLYFVNPAGIVFGRDAHVKANSFVAAAANLSDMNFVRGIDAFTGGAGTVSNAGAIEADFAALIGGRVANTGTITSADGVVAMISGDQVTLGRRGDTVSVKVTGGTPGELPGTSNAGTIKAGRRVVIGAGDLYSLAVENRGTITAPNVTLQATAGKGAIVDVGGTIDASSSTGVGGRVEVLGDYVALQGATIDASGRDGGGTVLVGGDWQGGGTTPRAKAVNVDARSAIHADAVGVGDGGTVVAFSNDFTRVEGTASAHGGAERGNGGSIEVSGGQVESQTAVIKTGATKGTAGLFLLDPKSILIQNITLNTANEGYPNIITSADQTLFEPKNKNAPGHFVVNQFGSNPDNDTIITPAQIIQALKDNGSVVVQTAITEYAPPDRALHSSAARQKYLEDNIRPFEGKITMIDSLIYDGAEPASLTLRAAAGIDIQNTLTSTTAPLDIYLLAREGFWDASRERFQDVNLGNYGLGRVNPGNNATVPEQTAVVIRPTTNGGQQTIKTRGGAFVARGIYVQSSLDKPDAAVITDISKPNFTDVNWNTVIDTTRTSGRGGAVKMDGQFTVEVGGIFTGGGDVQLRADRILSRLGRIPEVNDGKFGNLVQRYSEIDAGTGSLSLSGKALILSGDGLQGGHVSLTATGNVIDAQGTIARDITIGDFISDLYFRQQLGPRTVSGTVEEIAALTAAFRARADPVLGQSGETFRRYSIVGRSGVDTYGNVRVSQYQEVTFRAASNDLHLHDGLDGGATIQLNAPHGSVIVDGNVGNFTSRRDALEVADGTVPVRSLSVDAKEIEVSSIFADGDVALRSTGGAGSISVKGLNPVILTQGTLTFAAQPTIDVDNGSLPPILATPNFAGDASDVGFEFDTRDLKLRTDKSPPEVFTVAGFYLDNQEDGTNATFNALTTSSLLPKYRDSFDVITFSPTARSAANEIAGATPQTSRTTEVARSIPTNLAAELKQVGVTVRPITADELIATLGGRALYNDTSAQPPYIQIGATNLSGRVADPRISSRLAAEVVSQYNLTVKRPARDDQGRVAVRPDGSVPLVDHVDQLKTNLTTAVNDYSTAHPGAIDPVALRAFIDQTPAYAGARADLANLQELFRLVDLVGLTPAEAANSRKQVTRPLLPPDTELDLPTFEATILNRPLPGTPTTAQ